MAKLKANASIKELETSSLVTQAPDAANAKRMQAHGAKQNYIFDL